MENKFCSECGCEILQPEDIGYEVEQNQKRKQYPMLKSSKVNVIPKILFVCKSCMEEQTISHQEWLKSAEAEYESNFNRWAKLQEK